MKLKGIFAPVPTPFFEDESIDEAGWRKNLRTWSRSGLNGIVIAGSNGELPYITMEERVLLTKIAAEEAGGKLHIMAGAHFPSTRETIACAKELGKAGAQSLLVLPPHYFKGSQRAIVKYYEDVADESPVPIFIYNMPYNTGVEVELETVLAAMKHPNVQGIKDTSGNMTKLGYMAAAAKEDFAVFAGTGNWFLAALAMGADGGTMAASILYTNTCQRIFKAFHESKIEQAAALQARLLPVSDAITRRFGIAGLKAALESRGMVGGPCRAPLMPLTEEAKREVLSILDTSGLDEFEGWRG